MPKLTIVTGTEFSTKFAIQQAVVRLGRGDDNEIVLDDVSVSRRHARIVRRSEACVVEDLHSSGGTFLNGRRVQREVLSDGDEIGIGRFSLIFQEDYEGAVPLGKTIVGDEDLETGSETAVVTKGAREPQPGAVPPVPVASNASSHTVPDLVDFQAMVLDEEDHARVASARRQKDSAAMRDRQSPEPLYRTDEMRALQETDPLGNRLLENLAQSSEPPAQAAAGGGAARLVILHKGNVIREENLQGFDLSIGRDQSNDIVLESIEVSRFHAKIVCSGGHYSIEDLGSSNGTYLGEERIREHTLKHGTEVRIGPFALMFRAPLDFASTDSDHFGRTMMMERGLDFTDPLRERSETLEQIEFSVQTTDPLRACEEPENPDPTIVDAAPETVGIDPAELARRAGAADRRDSPAAARPGATQAPSAPAARAASGPLMLLVLDGAHEGDLFPLTGARTTVGRDDTADITIHDDSVSRTHAVITRGPLRFEVQDLGSTNGTFLNGGAIDRAPINAGDRLTFGNVSVLVSPSDDADQASSADIIPLRRRRLRIPMSLVGIVAALLAVLSIGTIAFVAYREKDRHEGADRGTPSGRASDASNASDASEMSEMNEEAGARKPTDLDPVLVPDVPTPHASADEDADREPPRSTGARPEAPRTHRSLPRKPPSAPPEQRGEPDADPVPSGDGDADGVQQRAAALMAQAFQAYAESGPEPALRFVDSALRLPIPPGSAERTRLEEIAGRLREINNLVERGEKASANGDLDATAAAWYSAMDHELHGIPAGREYLSRRIGPKLAQVEYQRGLRSVEDGKPALGYDRFKDAVRLAGQHAEAQRQIKEIDARAKELFQQALMRADTDPDQAKEVFQEVMRLVPPDHEYHRRSREKLRNLQ
ncbi:MAG: FHA domain-containing protein [Candidatus Schekmanbacteria bacterium]|nr:FHA domain-containing protein [Candidatus Schekmanbacteria bacterium]